MHPNFREFIFHALECIRSSPSLFIRESWLFATLQPTRRWVEEVAGLADDREIAKLFHEFFGRRAVQVVGVVALLVVVVVLLFLVLNWYVAPTKPSERKDLILAVAQILGGTALLSGLYFTWRTLQVNREGQITERFTRAIDQLGKVDDKGNKLFEIRIGGIYALERIARESEEDHWPVMEILTAYVRQHAHAPWQPEEEQQGVEDTTTEKPEEDSGDSRGESEPTEDPAPDPDIQAIMTVLRRRTRSFGHGETESLDLQGTHLPQADLRGANLTQADLRGANLTKVMLMEAGLARAALWQACLRGADLFDADLSQAKLWGADLSGADLSQANLSGADLTGANLSGADLQRANLSGAYLMKANFTGALLYGADFSQATLRQGQLEHTAGDKITRLPSHLKPPAHWGVKTDEQIEGS